MNSGIGGRRGSERRKNFVKRMTSSFKFQSFPSVCARISIANAAAGAVDYLHGFSLIIRLACRIVIHIKLTLANEPRWNRVNDLVRTRLKSCQACVPLESISISNFQVTGSQWQSCPRRFAAWNTKRNYRRHRRRVVWGESQKKSCKIWCFAPNFFFAIVVRRIRNRKYGDCERTLCGASGHFGRGKLGTERKSVELTEH